MEATLFWRETQCRLQHTSSIADSYCCNCCKHVLFCGRPRRNLVQKRFTVRESARLLGVDPSTVSRHLPPGRVRRGQRASLTTDEVLDLAPEVGVDRQDVQRK